MDAASNSAILNGDDLIQACRRSRVRQLALFGSAARGDFDPERSDLDFLVDFESLEPADFADAYFALRDALASMFGRPIDLLTEAALENPYLRARVRSERRIVYQS
jgi:predicted nucleotidyltransferase